MLPLGVWLQEKTCGICRGKNKKAAGFMLRPFEKSGLVTNFY